MSSVPEVEWDDTEQAWMLALQQYRDGLCPLCGRPVEVCGNPENEGKFKAGLPSRCHAQTAILVAQEKHESGSVKPKHTGALLYSAQLDVV